MVQQGLWHLRIHYGDYDPVKVIEFIKSKALLVLCVKEIDANRPHLHNVITEFKQTKSTFIQQMLKEFPNLNGNGSYSCSKKDHYDALVRYCLKGESKETKPDVLYHNDLDIDFYHNEYWKENSLLKAKSKDGNMGLQKDTSLVLKTKSKTWTEKVFDEMKELYSADIMAIQTFQLIHNPTDFEVKSERQSRITLYHYMKKRLGPKKQSDYILRDLFTGFISGFIQEHSESAEKYNLREYNRIFSCSI